jgi:DNA primase
LADDEITFSNPQYAKVFEVVRNEVTSLFADDLRRKEIQLQEEKQRMLAKGIAEIQKTAINLSEIKGQEKILEEECEAVYQSGLIEYSVMYIVNNLISSPDDVVRKVTTNLVSEKYVLSKVHTKFAKIDTEQDKIVELVPRAIFEWKDAILECKLRDIKAQLRSCADVNEQLALMSQCMELQQIKIAFAKYLGERIVAPRK